MDHNARRALIDEIRLSDELNRSFCFSEKSSSSKCYIVDSGLSFLSLGWIDVLKLFSMPLNPVFNVFSLS